MKKEENSIWVVTYWDDDDRDPTITCFGNYEAAEKCYSYFKNKHKFCCIDNCELYNVFYQTNTLWYKDEGGRMTLDEAIKHAEEIAEQNFNNAVYIMDKAKSDIAISNAEECKRCAEQNIQLAKWLKELKQLREQNIQFAKWLKELKQLRDQTRWIPVSEELPEEDVDVLVRDAEGDMAVGYYREDAKAWDSTCCGWLELDVIEWRPLEPSYTSESE